MRDRKRTEKNTRKDTISLGEWYAMAKWLKATDHLYISSPGRSHGTTSAVDGAFPRGWRPSWWSARPGRDGALGLVVTGRLTEIATNARQRRTSAEDETVVSKTTLTVTKNTELAKTAYRCLLSSAGIRLAVIPIGGHNSITAVQPIFRTLPRCGVDAV